MRSSWSRMIEFACPRTMDVVGRQVTRQFIGNALANTRINGKLRWQKASSEWKLGEGYRQRDCSFSHFPSIFRHFLPYFSGHFSIWPGPINEIVCINLRKIWKKYDDQLPVNPHNFHVRCGLQSPRFSHILGNRNELLSGAQEDQKKNTHTYTEPNSQRLSNANGSHLHNIPVARNYFEPADKKLSNSRALEYE